MASAIGGKVNTFRETFKIANIDVLRWFPGHMGKGIKQMEGQLKNTDLLIEVHDARVPVSGRYADFKRSLCGIKPHVLVLSKVDLADTRLMCSADNLIKKQGVTHIIQTNLKDETSEETRKILPLCTKLICESNRFNRSTEAEFNIMVIGVPNVGKSSLINRLRNIHLKKAKAAKVGPKAGCTRSLMNRIKINQEPLVYLYDTPGILPPNIPDPMTGLKLALAGCSADHLVGPEFLADFLLFYLNKSRRFEYVEKLGLVGPTDDYMEVLIQLALKAKKMKKIKMNNDYLFRPDTFYGAEKFINAFRNGELGLYCLDQDILEKRPEE